MKAYDIWVTKAEMDYKASTDLHGRQEDTLPETVCYHCQQCVEKYLKAYLVMCGETPPRIHDLEALLTLCAVHDSGLNAMLDAVSSLTRYAVDIRYPGDSASDEEAEAALKNAEEVRNVIRAKLGL